MPKRPPTRLKSALRHQQRRLAAERYPGDLADDVLARMPKRGLRLPAPAVAFALFALCACCTAWFVLHTNQRQDEVVQRAIEDQHHNNTLSTNISTSASETHTEADPDPALNAPASMPPTVASTIPEIDRALLPVRRSGGRTWLAMPAQHTRATTRQAQLVAGPKPLRPGLAVVSPPSRRDLNRLFERTRTLIPERT